MWFLNGLLLGMLIGCLLIIYANTVRPRPHRLPRDCQRIECKNGTVSFDGRPGYQNIPCRIEICHTYRYGYDKRLRVIEDHAEIRRYCLDVPLPVSACSPSLFFKVVDSDGVSSMAYIGSQNTLIQGG